MVARKDSSTKLKKQGAAKGKAVPPASGKKKKAGTGRVKPAGMEALAGRAEFLPNIYLIFALVVLGYIILTGPFQRGLFFTHELLPVHLWSFGLFIPWWLVRLWQKEEAPLQTPLDWAVFALALFYFLSIFVAAERVAAVEEFLKVANYLVVYLLVFDISRRSDLFRFSGLPGASKTGKSSTSKDGRAAAGKVTDAAGGGSAAAGSRNRFAACFSSLADGAGTGRPGLVVLLHILLLAGVAVAVGGLGAAAGTWELHGAYVGGRIHTPLQYPNTGAAYLTAAFFLAAGLALLMRSHIFRTFYLLPASVILTAFIFTFSRGAWLLMPFLAIFFVLAAGAGNRLRALFYVALPPLGVLPFMREIDTAFRGDLAGQAWAYILGAAVLAWGAGLLAELFLGLNLKVKLAAAAATAALVIFAGFSLFLPLLDTPLHLERSLQEGASHQYLEQKVGSIEGGEPYLLSLEVNAAQEDFREEEDEPGYAWRVLVRGYDLDEEGATILDHREGPTDGWEEKELELLPEEDIQRLEVRLYNRYPGTSVTARNVLLRDAAGAERSLTFALHRALPHGVYTRIQAIGAGERSVDARLDFYGDALKIIRDYPVLGSGGGGWNALYQGYQERDYYTTEVHSHYLQVWVETGTPGFLAFLGLWISVAFAFFRNMLREKAPSWRRSCWLAVFFPLLALGLHSVIDFNFSLGAVSIFLFALLGAARSLEEGESYGAFPWRRLRELQLSVPGGRWTLCLAGALIALLLFSYTYSMWSGYRAGARASQMAEQNRVQEAVPLFREALRRDSNRPSHYLNLASIYEQAASQEEDRETAGSLRREALELTRRAYQLAPYDTRHNLEYGSMLLRHGQVDEGLSYIERVLELHPYRQESYRQVADAHLSAAERYLQDEEEEEAREHLQRVLELEAEMERTLEDTRPLNFDLGKAAYLLEDYSAAEEYLGGVSEGDDRYLQSRVYLAALYREQERTEEAGEMEELFEEEEGLQQLYETLLAE